jgi:hypothetical protein
MTSSTQDFAMRPPHSGRLCLLALAAAFFLAYVGSSHAAPAGAGADATKPVRKLAPGVEQTIPLEREAEETAAIHDVVELTEGTPNLPWKPNEYEETKTLFFKSKGAVFRRGIWQLQFTFKPLRMIRVDVPQTNGKMKSQLVWYMVYRVTNPGGHITPVQSEAGKFHGGAYSIAETDSHTELLANIGPIRFIPTFLLRTHRSGDLAVDNYTVEHMDVVLPAARPAIYQRERPSTSYAEFFDTATMARDPVPVSTGRAQVSRWGVVTWINVDHPLGADGTLDMNQRIDVDFFTVHVMGLTNAYKFADPPGALKPGDKPATGRLFAFKTLQLNFYRPGDEFDAREDEIRWGVDGHPKYKWIYRPAVLTFRPHRPRL